MPNVLHTYIYIIELLYTWESYEISKKKKKKYLSALPSEIRIRDLALYIRDTLDLSCGRTGLRGTRASFVQTLKHFRECIICLSSGLHRKRPPYYLLAVTKYRGGTHVSFGFTAVRGDSSGVPLRRAVSSEPIEWPARRVRLYHPADVRSSR